MYVFCDCFYFISGKTDSRADISSMRLSDSAESCTFKNLQFDHGDNVYVYVQCINNVELGSEVVSEKIVISSEAPDVSQASVRVISPFHDVSIKQYDGVNVTYIVTDGTRTKLEWDGFHDQSGVDKYEYRIMYMNDTVVDWKNTDVRKAVDVQGLSLHSGRLYKVEVRAINIGEHVSDPVSVGLIIQREPSVTGNDYYYLN